MIGDVLSKARKDISMTKTKLSEKTDINIGHLTHIEQGKRNPSHKALRNLCDALNLPYQPLMHTYDKELSEEQKEYNLVNNISYKKIPVLDNITDFIDCPLKVPNASMALKINDDSMVPTLKLNSYVYLEWNTIPNNKDIGLFKYNDTFYIRRLILRRGSILLRADNKEIEDILISDLENLQIIGKIFVVK